MTSDPSARYAITKHSLLIAGHSTSISLEAVFWQRLRHVAAARGMAVAALVAAVDADRGDANLSSAIRVFLLEDALGGTPRATSAVADLLQSKARSEDKS